jgi:hypothetical protein
MFVGHYAAAFAAQSVRRGPSLTTSFVAVQLIDIAAFSLAYFGIEKWRPNPSITGLMPLDLYYMPYTHSLLGCTLWALAAAIIVAKTLSAPGRRAIAGVVTAALVLSHWVLDLLVHRHDLGILGDGPPKLGFGLWDYPHIEIPLELGLLVVGFGIYLWTTKAVGRWGRVLPWLVMAMLVVFQFANWFGPLPADPFMVSTLVLLTYLTCVGGAWLLDRTRARRDA